MAICAHFGDLRFSLSTFGGQIIGHLCHPPHQKTLFSRGTNKNVRSHAPHTHSGQSSVVLGTDQGWITIHNGPVLQKSELALDLTLIEWPRPVLCPASSRVFGLPLLLHLFALRDDGALFALALTHLLCSFLSNLRSITTRGPVLKMGWNSLRMGHTGRRRQQQPRTFETSSSPELINEVVAVIGRVYYANGQVRVGFIRWVVRSFVRRGTRMAITSHNNNKWSSSSSSWAEAELRFF